MRVISIIVHLIALCDPALHKTTEEAAHPSLLNKRGVNFALLLFFSFLPLSLEAFYSIFSMLRVLATMPRPGMHSIWFTLLHFHLVFLYLARLTFYYLIMLYSFCL